MKVAGQSMIVRLPFRYVNETSLDSFFQSKFFLHYLPLLGLQADVANRLVLRLYERAALQS